MTSTSNTAGLVIRNSKFGKSRQLPLDLTTTGALRDYLHLRDQLKPLPAAAALLIGTRGDRLSRGCAEWTFRLLRDRVGLQSRPGCGPPRLHDLRHTFAVRTMLDSYRTDGDPAAMAAALSTYLGHADPGATYWYLSAAPGAARARRHPARRPPHGGSLMSALAPTLQAFFTERLIAQRHASPHTIASYRDTMRLLLAFAQQRLATPPAQLDLAELDADLIAAFLDHLEHERNNTIGTRNARLAAIRSLYTFASLRHPEHAAADRPRARDPTQTPRPDDHHSPH